jgi:hypothetical protein
MQTRNPFASTPAMKDEQVHRLYAAIDGRKTVIELISIEEMKDYPHSKRIYHS